MKTIQWSLIAMRTFPMTTVIRRTCQTFCRRYKFDPKRMNFGAVSLWHKVIASRRPHFSRFPIFKNKTSTDAAGCRARAPQHISESIMDSIKDINGTPFSVLMDQAVRLKTAQLASSRTKFDSFPSFYQQSLFASAAVQVLRCKSIEERLVAAQQLKEDGNASFYNKEYGDALNKYSEVVSIFRYLENKNAEWKSQGIQDEDIVEVRFDESSTTCRHQEESITSLLLSCYTNMALASIKLRQYQTAIDACNDSLELDRTCVKALFLRAKARMEPASAGGAEERMAAADLCEAGRLDPSNQQVKILLRRIRESARKHRAGEKHTFGGLFDKGSIYEDSSGSEFNKNEHVSNISDRSIALDSAKMTVDALMAKGMDAEAETVRNEIKKAESNVDNNELLAVDFRSPTEAMVHDAKRFNIDLTDDRVIAMLEDLQHRKQTEDIKTNGTFPPFLSRVFTMMLSVRSAFRDSFCTSFQSKYLVLGLLLIALMHIRL